MNDVFSTFRGVEGPSFIYSEAKQTHKNLLESKSIGKSIVRYCNVKQLGNVFKLRDFIKCILCDM